ncbi:MAG TPA: carbamoyltransferase, partial [Blastocatellia bacterium]|nr:carbamoyltransferase [Blastocatellia bacterium]
NILGISAFYHDSAAALIRDGEIIAAAQEERFTRIRHDAAFPERAIDYCLREARITRRELDAVVFYEKPLVKIERLMETYLGFAPRGLRSFLTAIPTWLREKNNITRTIRKGLGKEYDGPVLFTEHHESHAASAFFPSPFESAAILTADGVGEWSTTTIGLGENNKLRLIEEIRFPHSLGLLYSAFTYYTGFKVNSGEYKVMGLAPYGEPKYVRQIYDHLIELHDDGSFRLNQEFFNYCTGLTMTSEKFHQLFGGPPRKPESKLTQKEMDLAASIQVVTEEAVLRLAERAHRITGAENLCLAGGVALNCVANGKLLKQGPFERIWIQPAAGDAGGALGAALAVWHQMLDKPRVPVPGDAMKGSLLGPEFSDEEIGQYLQSVGAVATKLSDIELVERLVDLMDAGAVIGWFRGRMEFGPRALGARSIIGDARNRNMQSVMNLKIKFRESFRPFAPCILRDHVNDYFGIDAESPYMLIVSELAEKYRLPLDETHQNLWGIDKLNVARSTVPAITHVDYSARIQTVDRTRHGLFHTLMQRFYERTSCPVIVNTSFNVRGEPIVCTPEDAYRCFMFTQMDVLALGDYLLLKPEQPEMRGAAEHLAQFALD